MDKDKKSFGLFKKINESDFNPGQLTIWIEKKIEEFKKRWAERKAKRTKEKRPIWDWEDCPAGQIFSWLKDNTENLFQNVKKNIEKGTIIFFEKYPKIEQKNFFYRIMVITIGVISVPLLWYITYLACI